MVSYAGLAPKALRLRHERLWHSRRVPKGGNPKGLEAELRFMRICQEFLSKGSFPEWVLEIVYSTHEEDRHGIDAVVLTKAKPIPVQIKSSVVGCVRFLEQDRFRHIPCILVDAALSDEEIFTFIASEITHIWEMRLRAHEAAV